MQIFIRHRPFSSSRNRSIGSRGFTLVEILTATAIMALLVSLVMTVLSQVVTAWNRSSDELDIGGKARTALDLIAADLQMAIFRPDGSQWLSCTTESTPNSPISGITNTRLIFFSTSPVHQSKDDSTSGKDAKPIYGDVCAIEYRVAYADPFGNASSDQKTFSLHRVAVDPASTFFGVNGKPLLGIYDGGPGNAKTLNEAFEKAEIDSSDKGTVNTIPGNQGKSLRVTIYGSLSHESILLDNVARFSVFLYYYGSNANPPPATQLYPETFPYNNIPAKYYYGGYGPSSDSKNFLDLISSTSSSGSPTFTRLAFADITMTVLKDDGVTLLNQFQGSMPSNLTWEDFLNRYGITYTERVRFFNSP